MRTHEGRSQAPEGMDTTTTSTPAPSDSSTPPTTRGDPTPTEGIQNIFDLPSFAPLEPGTYFIDPDDDPSTPLRVVYEVSAEGWTQWAGAGKFGDEGGHVAVSITTVSNLVSDGCSDHSWADPPVGPTVDDLATALADLAPFRVTSPPEDVSIYGYRGKHLELIVANLPVEGSGEGLRFTGCIRGDLKSWVAAFDTAPGHAFYGYTGPGYTEEFWILDVAGTRLMIAAETVRRLAGEGPRGTPRDARLHMGRAMRSIPPRSCCPCNLDEEPRRPDNRLAA